MIKDIQESQIQAKKDRDINTGASLVRARSIVEESASLTPFFEAAFAQLDAILPLSSPEKQGAGRKADKQAVQEAENE